MVKEGYRVAGVQGLKKEGKAKIKMEGRNNKEGGNDVE